jgi:hypothetical protein
MPYMEQSHCTGDGKRLGNQYKPATWQVDYQKCDLFHNFRHRKRVWKLYGPLISVFACTRYSPPCVFLPNQRVILTRGGLFMRTVAPDRRACAVSGGHFVVFPIDGDRVLI